MSMTEVNAELIEKIAELSRLELNASEIAEYVKSIGDILKHVEQLSEVEVAGIEPMYYGIDEALRLREDRASDANLDESGKPKVLLCAPDVQDDGYKVPQIIA